ncbi:MAG TPA: EscU/YscU/HrcU family type III secretion system export apparatus switch protein [Ramlibacter sp.]|nr:EscU/YscU/HrcU family type III secretion system export apparatus switch protein [Ramlibacter sp.]
MNEPDSDRSEAATPHKLKRAHEEGQAARSADLVGAIVFGAAALYGTWQGWDAALATAQLFRSALGLAGQAVAVGDALPWPLIQALAGGALQVLAPLLLLLLVAAVLGSVVQTGFVWSLTPLKPDLRRLDPVQGLRRLLSLRTLWDALRACLKLVVLVGAAVLALQALLPHFASVANRPPAALLRQFVQDAGSLALRMAAVLVLLALLDLAWNRREFGRRMRMSRREVKEEHRNREGDPRIRSRLRELRAQLLRRTQSLRNTGDADVVLANPTHYAVALRYVHGEMDAPRVVAKGAGQLAAAMRALARRRQIPVVENPPLARLLFRSTDIDQSIPSSTHADVARIIVWVFAMRERRAGRAA